MKRSPRRGQAGQTLMIFTLAFALFLFAVTCLVADSAFLFRWSSAVQGAAQLAAQSGADSVDPRYLYGLTQPCPPPRPGQQCAFSIVDTSPQDRRGTLFAFQRACIQAGDQSAHVPRNAPSDLTPKGTGDSQQPEGTVCASNGCQVFAMVTRRVHLPIPLPGFPDSVSVSGTYYAAPVVGTNTAQSSCAGGAWVPAPPAP
jgi:hypothetical protein